MLCFNHSKGVHWLSALTLASAITLPTTTAHASGELIFKPDIPGYPSFRWMLHSARWFGSDPYYVDLTRRMLENWHERTYRAYWYQTYEWDPQKAREEAETTLRAFECKHPLVEGFQFDKPTWEQLRLALRHHAREQNEWVKANASDIRAIWPLYRQANKAGQTDIAKMYLSDIELLSTPQLVTPALVAELAPMIPESDRELFLQRVESWLGNMDMPIFQEDKTDDAGSQPEMDAESNQADNQETPE